jgi:TetR/AcrR family transcriptional repressor of nem operon
MQMHLGIAAAETGNVGLESALIEPAKLLIELLAHEQTNDRHRWDDLERWFLAQIALQKRFRMTRGCPFGTIGNEVTENDELIRQDLSLIFEVIRTKLAVFLIRQKAAGRLDATVKEDDLADFCLATIQGAMLMGKVKRSSRLAERVVGEAMAHLRRYARVRS